jgi:hypothetical protein
MIPKERVLTTFARQEADRVPINYLTNPGIDARLKTHFGLISGDDEGLRRALGVDFREVRAPYVGPKLHEDVGNHLVDNYGVHRRWVEHGSGGYWDFCEFPLRNADEETVANWPMPSPDDFDYSQIARECKKHEHYAVHIGGAGLCDAINSSGYLRSMEQIFMDLVTDDPAGLLIMKRRTEINLEITRRTIEAARGGFDFMWIGEDLGTQNAPMMDPETYRRNVRPINQKYIDLAKAYDLPVMIHCCGSSSWVYPDFIEMGIDVVDTLQPEAKDMAPAYLKKTFGDRLAFHGCISTAGPVAFGSVQEVIDNCRETLEIMMPGGGYCFAPTHALQDNSPTENVLAMYECGNTYGTYQ